MMNIIEEYNSTLDKDKILIQVPVPESLKHLFRFIAESEGLTFSNRWINTLILPAAQQWIEDHPNEFREFEIWWDSEKDKRAKRENFKPKKRYEFPSQS